MPGRRRSARFPQGWRVLCSPLEWREVGAVMGGAIPPPPVGRSGSLVRRRRGVGGSGARSFALAASPGRAVRRWRIEHARWGGKLHPFEDRGAWTGAAGRGWRTSSPKKGALAFPQFGGVGRCCATLRPAGSERPPNALRESRRAGRRAGCGRQFGLVRDARRLEQIGEHGGGGVAYRNPVLPGTASARARLSSGTMATSVGRGLRQRG